MNPHDVAQLARQMLNRHELHGWTFAFNNRKRALGVCRYAEQRIELSLHFVMHNGREAVVDTILHEIAHALAGADAGHGPQWRSVCQQIGARPERCDTQSVMPAGRWRATCPGCKAEHSRHRKPMTDRTYICRQCGPQHGKLKFLYNRTATMRSST